MGATTHGELCKGRQPAQHLVRNFGLCFWQRAEQLVNSPFLRSVLACLMSCIMACNAASSPTLRGGPHPLDRFSSQLRWNPGFMIQAA